MCKHSQYLDKETCALCQGYEPTYIAPPSYALDFNINIIPNYNPSEDYFSPRKISTYEKFLLAYEDIIIF